MVPGTMTHLMSSITLNNEPVALVEQDRETFRKFTELCFPQCVSMLQIPKEHRYIAMLPASYVIRRRREGAEWTDPMVQVALWNLHDLGVQRMSFGAEAAAATPEESRPQGDPEDFVRFDQAEATDMAHGRPTSINFSTVKSGRAFIAALNNVIHRVFTLNGEVFDVGIQPRPELEKAAQQVHQSRQNEEGLLFATARALGAHIRQGRTREDLEVRCVIELLTNMGCVGVMIDPDAGKMTFTNFSTMAALSSALLQGLGWDQLKEIRKNVETFQEQIMKGGDQPIRPAMAGPVGSRRRRS
jgi:hypothetical protein